MSEKPISPLRRRMIEDMTIRGFGEKTQNDYIRHVKTFTIFLGRAPDQAEPADLRAYQLHQRESRVQPPTMNSTVAALRFFFTTTCDRPEMARHLRLVKQQQKLPVVLTPEEVLPLLEAAPGPKYKAALAVAYGAGLRVSEVANSWSCSGSGGWSDSRRHGCFPGAMRCCQSRRASSIGLFATRPPPSASRSGSLPTRSGTALPRIFSSKGSTFV
jgi:hypothetical protein